MKILVIDDEKNIGTSIKTILEDEGYSVHCCLTYAEGMKVLENDNIDLIFLDIWLPDIDGIDGLRDIKRTYPQVEVVMISGHATIENALEATRLGAYDFIEKPIRLERLVSLANQLEDKLKIVEDLRSSRYKLAKKYSLIGKSTHIKRLQAQIDKVASMNSWVLITGENGTGKEHVARLVHLLSDRRDKPFIDINCSAIPNDLVESELFGYEKGAFTGATARKIGKLELANNGCLFLDEIGDMNMLMQAKLLRVLEVGSFSRLGSVTSITSNFRLICATNKNLASEIENGHFRQDLFYRINIVPIEVPALRDRREDIPLLVQHFIHEASKQNAIPEKKVSQELMNLLQEYSWPGNVRQLKNIIERILVMAEGDTLDIESAPPFLVSGKAEAVPIDSIINLDTPLPLKDAKDEFEKAYILKFLQATNWDIPKTAKILDMERTYLYKKIKTLNLEKN